MPGRGGVRRGGPVRESPTGTHDVRAPARGGGRARWSAALLVIALVSAVVAYAPGLSSPFVFDDQRYLEQNTRLLRLWPPEWIHAGTQETRPVTNLSFALDHAVLGRGAFGHHLVNLALHLASVLLLFAAVRRMLPATRGGPARDRNTIAGLAAIILALHPAHSTSVLYLQCRSGLLATVFGLAALLVAAGLLPRWAHARHRTRGTCAAAALAALAALSKESGAVMPALLLTYDVLLVPREDARALRERALRFHLPVWAGLIPLAVTYLTLHNPHVGVFGFGVVDPARFYLTQPLALLLDLRLYLWPAGLTVDRSFPLLSPGDPRVWIGVAGLALVLAIAFRASRRSAWIAFWAIVWLAALAPTSLVPSPDFAAERYFTLATPAVAAIAAWILDGIASSGARVLRLARAFASLGLGLLVALPLGWATFRRAVIWRSDLALWREATRVSPGNSRAWYQYAVLLHESDSLQAASQAAHRALAIGTPNHLPLLLLSDIEAATGEIDSSVVFADAAARLVPWNAAAHLELARALGRVGRWAESEREADRAVSIDPGSAAARYRRGLARLALGDSVGARADAASLSAIGSAGVQAAALEGMIAAGEDRPTLADTWLARATDRFPSERDESLACIDALRARAPVLLALGRADEAIHVWQV
ncbi:MAG TPA: hypothetical protein VMS88_06775, partial [Terriglobales bacterium]|nr:hypothetical protein [Terriglobales bacterium]